MGTSSDTRIGRVIEVTGEYLEARLDGSGDQFSAELNVDGKRMRIGQIGSYLRVSQSGLDTLTMVEHIREEQAPNGVSRYVVRLAPMGEINEKGGFERGVTEYPTVGAEVHIALPDALQRVFLRQDAREFRIGHLSEQPDVGVYLNPTALFSRHFAVLGQTGAGKSWTVTSLLQSALKSMPNAHIIVLDLHGEYGREDDEGNTETPFHAHRVRCLKARDLEFPYWLLTFAELTELLMDPEDENYSVQMAFLREAVVNLKREANAGMGRTHISVDSPVYFSMDELVEKIAHANKKTTDFGKGKAPLFGKFDQFLVRLESLLNDTRYEFLLRPKKRTSSNSLEELLRDFVGLGYPGANITVLDLSAVPFDVLPIVTAQVGRLAYEFSNWNPRRSEFPLFLVCEEAHEYIPRDDNPKFRTARRAMERIAKNGRKYGVGLCVISQRPHELSETVLSQCGTYLCLHLSNPDDQRYVAELVPDTSRGMLGALTALSRGEAIGMGEAVPMPVRFQVDLPDPPPYSSDVDYGRQWHTGPRDIDVKDLIQRWQKQIR